MNGVVSSVRLCRLIGAFAVRIQQKLTSIYFSLFDDAGPKV